jgi:hypothetical protein
MRSFHRDNNPPAYTVLIALWGLLYVPAQGFASLAGDVPGWLRGTVGAVFTLIAVWNVVQPQAGRFSEKQRWIASCVQGTSLILFWTAFVLDRIPFVSVYGLSFIIPAVLHIVAHVLVDRFRTARAETLTPFTKGERRSRGADASP